MFAALASHLYDGSSLLIDDDGINEYKAEGGLVVQGILWKFRRKRVQRDFYAAPMRWWSISCRAVDLPKVFDEMLEELFKSV